MCVFGVSVLFEFMVVLICIGLLDMLVFYCYAVFAFLFDNYWLSS